MAKVLKKIKQEPQSDLAINEIRERDAMAFAQLLYDIYQDKKRKEKEKDNELSSNI